MRRIVNSTFVSLDGVINHMDRWHSEFVDDELQALALDQLRDADAMLMGRHTYEGYAAVWQACEARVRAMCDDPTPFEAVHPAPREG